MKNFIKLLLLLIIFSCSNKTIKKEEIKIKFKSLEITFEDVEKVTKKDNFIVLNELDTIYYNKGIGINKLVEKEPKIVYLPLMQDKEEEAIQLQKFDSLGFRVVRNRSYDLDRYRNQNVTYKTIGGKTMKIVFPRIKNGITGIYVDSLGKGSDGDVYGEMKINLYGKNLSKESRESFLNAINTIKFNLE